MFIIIPGILVAVVTFPGVFVHEFAHRFFCDIMQVPVYDIRYFKWGKNDDSVGHVIHEAPANIRSAILIGLAPLLINSVLCVMLILPCIIHFFVLQAGLNIFWAIQMWLAFSIGVHAIPSDTDMNGILKSLHRFEARKGLIYTIKICTYIFSILEQMKLFIGVAVGFALSHL